MFVPLPCPTTRKLLIVFYDEQEVRSLSMPRTTVTPEQGLRSRLFAHFNSARRRSSDSSSRHRVRLPSGKQAVEEVVDTNIEAVSRNTSRITALDQSGSGTGEPSNTSEDVTATSFNAQSTSNAEQTSATPSIVVDNVDISPAPADVWSTAFREAVATLGKDLDVAILESKNIIQLLKELEEKDKESDQDSAFLRGVKYLHRIKVPLENLKLALDVADPLTGLEPTVRLVYGVVRGVTAVAISLASADVEFAKKIGEMLEHISYIDDCDTLGQKSDRQDIHKALVPVYQKIIEFYKVASNVLKRRGAKLVVRMILEKEKLPSIVEEFLRYASTLRALVQKATWEVVEDVKTMLYDREIDHWLGDDKLRRQVQYHEEMCALRADHACEFLLKHDNFKKWYSSHNCNHLVVLGDMGSGKTVTMAYLVDELHRRNEHQLPQPKNCYYYCRDDNNSQAAHIYSSLVLALLKQLNGLKKTFHTWYKQNQASGELDPAANPRKLAEFLQTALKSLDRSLFILVDGLDECDLPSRNSLISLLKTLSAENPNIKSVLFSRPDPEILQQLNGMVKVEIVPDATRDRIIVGHMVDWRLPSLSQDVKSLVIQEVSRMAQGSAIWTKMTMKLIEVRKIKALGPMKQFLGQVSLPSELSKLYETLLSRCTSDDPDNHELAIIALKVLAVSRRPLSITELAWAAALGMAPEDHRTVDDIAMLVDHERVIGLIQPFVSNIDFEDVKKAQVRLVHQSVKEFIVRNHAMECNHSRDRPIQRAVGQAGPATEALEAFMLGLCIKYLLLDDIDHITFFSLEQMAIDELPQIDIFDDGEEAIEYDRQCTWEVWEKDMVRYDPTERGFGEFFVYASCYWVDHFGAAVEDLPDLRDIERLCQAGSLRLQNWTEQHRRPYCTFMARFQFESRLYDPLSITALYGSEAMLCHMLKASNFDKAFFLPRPALEAADQIIQWGDCERLEILVLEGGLTQQLRDLDFWERIIFRWSDPGMRTLDWNPVFDLIPHTLDALVEEHSANELLCIAARAGCMPIIQRLIRRAQHWQILRHELLRVVQRQSTSRSSFNKHLHQSVGEAVLGNHVDVVEFLLQLEGINGHLQYINSHGENVLHLASRHCNPEIFGILAPLCAANSNQADDQGNTAVMQILLSSASSEHRYESARLLLQEGPVGESSQDEQENTLRLAVRLGDLDMCRLLLEVGNVEPLLALERNDDGLTVLKDAPLEDVASEDAILQLLKHYASRYAKLS